MSNPNYELAGKILELVEGHAADKSHTGLIWKIEALLAERSYGPDSADALIVARAFKEWRKGGFPNWPGKMAGYESSTASENGVVLSRSHRCGWCDSGSEWQDVAVPIQHDHDCPVSAAERLCATEEHGA